jgi:hypothetical protein
VTFVAPELVADGGKAEASSRLAKRASASSRVSTWNPDLPQVPGQLSRHGFRGETWCSRVKIRLQIFPGLDGCGEGLFDAE